MSFRIDKQTLDELNLLGKFRHGSVYHLFNQVKTRGGEQLLENMFHHLLEDEAAINARSSIFRFFQQSKLAFPFDVQQVSLMREYLDTGAGTNALVAIADTLVKKMLSSLARDQRYKKNIQGLQATILTLQRCYAVVDMIPNHNSPFSGRLKTIRQILANNQLLKLRDTDIYQALPVKTIALYGHLLKNRLQEDMHSILTFIYELDVHIAVSDVAAARGFTYATAMPAERNVFTAKDLAHPCIDGAVGNSLEMEENSNVMFLTGANMAGKSTLMKSIGIGMYLAHMGFPVAAAQLEFSVREGLYTSINVADNIALGYSHFYAEVVRVKQAADATSKGQRLMLMFDELFKGTNVKDAYDGTLAVTEAFSGYRDCLFIVSTHIIEVGEALKSHANIQFRYLPTIMEGSRPQYTFKLEEGITEDRQGMMIIRNEGILELIHSK